jgi:hypothetical protein
MLVTSVQASLRIESPFGSKSMISLRPLNATEESGGLRVYTGTTIPCLARLYFGRYPQSGTPKYYLS